MTSPRRSVATTATLALAAGLAGGFVLGRDVGTTGQQVGPPAVVSPPVVPVSGPLTLATSCDALVDHYVDGALDLVTPWGWERPIYALSMREEAGDLASAVVPRDATVSKGVTSSDTGTNVQEAGVDEPDVVKADGALLVRAVGQDLVTYDVSGDRVRELASVPALSRREQTPELLLAGDRVVLTSTEWERPQGRHWGGPHEPTTVVRHYDVSDPASPRLVTTQEYGGRLLSARLYDDVVRLVLSSGLPDLDFVQPGDDRSEKQALAENRNVLRASTAEDWLMSVATDDGDAEPAADCADVQLPEEFSGAGSVVVVGFIAGAPAAAGTTAVAATSDLVYSSTDRLYLATMAGWGWGGPCCLPFRDLPGSGPEQQGTTDLHAFALDGPDTVYAGSGEVAGRLRDRWSMDAADDVLRVAVGPTSETGDFSSVVTFEEQDGELVELGRVDRLGIGEEIQSVRWFDDLAIVVTFRQVDPLYSIDLSDPARPRQLGELKIPGFSSYLHPIGHDQMIGIGTDADRRGVTRGGQAATFDLSELTDPRRVDVVGYGKRRQTRAGEDPRQFTWLDDRRTALTVVGQWGRSGGATAYVSVLEVGQDGTLDNRMVVGGYGHRAVEGLRTVPLPDGRVVLSSDRGARFLDL